MINKYTQDMFLVSFLLSDELFDGTVFDGILLIDNCVFPDYFETTYNSSLSHADSQIPDKLQLQYVDFFDKHKKIKLNGNRYSFNSNREIYFRDQPEWFLHYILQFPRDVISIFTHYFEPFRNQIDDEISSLNSGLSSSSGVITFDNLLTEKIEETNPTTIWQNYKEITQTIDFDEIYKQQKLPGLYIFHIQAVYRMFGERMPYSAKKLIDAVSYNTLLNVQTKMFQSDKYWNEDEWLEPFVLKNSIDTMYYTRHTQIDLRNPYHNDYLRYHPRCNPSDEMNKDEAEYKHFIPLTTERANTWSDIYRLGKELVKCELHRTEFPYVFSLTSKDSRVKEHEFAKIYTLEGRRYVRVILNKIHSDKTKPLHIKCRPVIDKSTNTIIGWIPVKYDS